MRLAGFRVDCFCRGPWRDLFNTRNSLSWFLVVEQPVRRREQRQGVVKVNAGARLVMERASFSLEKQTPARRSTLIPSTPVRGTPRGEALRSFYISLVNTVCVVACLRSTYLAPIPQHSTVTLVRALAMGENSEWFRKVQTQSGSAISLKEELPFFLWVDLRKIWSI